MEHANLSPLLSSPVRCPVVLHNTYLPPLSHPPSGSPCPTSLSLQQSREGSLISASSTIHVWLFHGCFPEVREALRTWLYLSSLASRKKSRASFPVSKSQQPQLPPAQTLEATSSSAKYAAKNYRVSKQSHLGL